MSENWIIALLGFVLTLGTYFLSMILKCISQVYNELKELRQALSDYVTHRECEGDMELHCNQLTELFHKVNENSKDITEMKIKINMYHK